MNRVAKQQGFTLIELVLAMAFVSALLLAIAMTVIQVGSMYSRGMMLKEVNQTSRYISNDFIRSINAQSTVDLSTQLVPVMNGGLEVGGRLCLGSVSYIWNYGEAIQKGDSALAKNADGEPVRIAKVVDATKRYCAKSGGGMLRPSIIAADRDQTSELLREGDRTLELYQLDISSRATAQDPLTLQRLLTIQYTIGSGNYTALNADRTACKGPNEPGSDIQYCTVEQFNATVRVKG